MKVSILNFNKLRNGEHFQFHSDFKELVQKFTPEKLSIKDAFEFYAHEDEA